MYGFCFCSFPAFPMKSRRSIHGEGRSTARSPPTQEAEALEITLPKSTAETAAEEGYQWPAVGESKAHVYSPCGASMVLFEDPPPHIMSVDGVGLRVCPVAIVCYGRSHMRVSAVALQHRLTGIERLASPIIPSPARPARLCATYHSSSSGASPRSSHWGCRALQAVVAGGSALDGAASASCSGEGQSATWPQQANLLRAQLYSKHRSRQRRRAAVGSGAGPRTCPCSC